MNAYRELAIVLAGLPEASLIETDDIGHYAVELVVRGWEVFPLWGKVPAIANPHPWGSPDRQTCKGECGRPGHGVLDATDDLEVVTSWWDGPYAGANIGARVPANVFVVDVDPRSGGSESLDALVASYGAPPETLTTASGRGDGGTHRYYRAPEGAALTSRMLGAGIDIKTHGGYCVVPPSVHPDTGNPYSWLVEAPIAEPPTWFLDLVVKVPPALVATPRRGVGTGGAGFWGQFTGASVADDYAETATWADILEPHGWRCLDQHGDSDGARWLHPAATSASSATVRHGCLFVYSPNTPFEETLTGDPKGVTKFRGYAVLEHGGDFSAAARTLRDGG